MAEKEHYGGGFLMRTIICYYTGTGNALALAKELKGALGDDTQLIRVTDYQNGANIELDADTVGFVFPVYFLSLPAIVKE
jgi:flavodoxin